MYCFLSKNLDCNIGFFSTITGLLSHQTYLLLLLRLFGTNPVILFFVNSCTPFVSELRFPLGSAIWVRLKVWPKILEIGRPWFTDQKLFFGYSPFVHIAGWWFGTFFLIFHILGISSPQLTNSIIFQRGSNHQPDHNIFSIRYGIILPID